MTPNPRSLYACASEGCLFALCAACDADAHPHHGLWDLCLAWYHPPHLADHRMACQAYQCPYCRRTFASLEARTAHLWHACLPAHGGRLRKLPQRAAAAAAEGADRHATKKNKTCARCRGNTQLKK